MLLQRALHILAMHFEAAADDDVVDAALDPQEPIRVENGTVGGPQPLVAGDMGATQLQHTLGSEGNRLAGLGIYDAGFIVGVHDPDRALVRRIVLAELADGPAGDIGEFRGPVGLQDGHAPAIEGLVDKVGAERRRPGFQRCQARQLLSGYPCVKHHAHAAGRQVGDLRTVPRDGRAPLVHVELLKQADAESAGDRVQQAPYARHVDQGVVDDHRRGAQRRRIGDRGGVLLVAQRALDVGEDAGPPDGDPLRGTGSSRGEHVDGDVRVALKPVA